MAIKTTGSRLVPLVCLLADDAIDPGESIEYARSLDWSDLQIVEGEAPTVFWVSALDSDATRKIERDSAKAIAKAGLSRDLEALSRELTERYFSAGLAKVENLGGDSYTFERVNGIHDVPREVLAKIPLFVQRDIGQDIKRLSDGMVAPSPRGEKTTEVEHIGEFETHPAK